MEPPRSGLPRKKISTPVPVPTEPLQSGHPRKSVSTSAPTSTVFEPLIEEAEAVTDLSSSIDEPILSEEPLDVKDKVNVDTKRDENILPLPADPARRTTVSSIGRHAAEAHLETDQVGGKLNEYAQVHTDGES